MSNDPTDDTMKDEYDFSTGTCGKFFAEGATYSPQVHLDSEVLKYLQAKAQARGTTLNELVNQLLKKDIELIEAAG